MSVVQINKLEMLEELNKKKRVCAYARVSTDEDKQLSSLDLQVSYYTKLILQNPDYIFSGVYSDEGLSGTSLNKREQFNVMFELARLGNIDLILTKSISRFSRNVLDTLTILKELRNINVEVFFEKENISSFDPKIEFVITVLATMAEEESKNNSENVKWSVRNNFKRGKFYLNTRHLLAYKRDEQNNIYIDKKEAQIVCEIFDMYLSGIGSSTIAKILTERKIKTIAGKSTWRCTSVIGVLRNEKYAGAALLQKTVSTDFRVKNSIKKQNIMPKYFIEDSHEAIISMDTFKKVQEKLNYRTPKQKAANTVASKKEHHTKYASLGICKICGSSYRHKINNAGTQYAKPILICTSYQLNKECNSRSILISSLEQIITNQLNMIVKNEHTLLTLAREAFTKDKRLILLSDKIRGTKEKLKALEVKRVESNNSNLPFNKLIINEIDDQIYSLKISLSKYNNEMLLNYNLEQQLEILKQKLKKLKTFKGNYEDYDYNEIFSKMILTSRDSIIFNLKFRHDLPIEYNLNEVHLKSKTEHLIRKTINTTFHGLRI